MTAFESACKNLVEMIQKKDPNAHVHLMDLLEQYTSARMEKMTYDEYVGYPLADDFSTADSMPPTY